MTELMFKDHPSTTPMPYDYEEDDKYARVAPRAPEVADGPIKTAAKRIGMCALAAAVSFGIVEGVTHLSNRAGGGLTPTELKAQQTIQANEMSHIAAEHQP